MGRHDAEISSSWKRWTRRLFPSFPGRLSLNITIWQLPWVQWPAMNELSPCIAAVGCFNLNGNKGSRGVLRRTNLAAPMSSPTLPCRTASSHGWQDPASRCQRRQAAAQRRRACLIDQVALVSLRCSGPTVRARECASRSFARQVGCACRTRTARPAITEPSHHDTTSRTDPRPRLRPRG